ncbi:hypothetical protein SCOR_01640 [Sulfidibacter corallicola]|uniref:Uncharacterized protein n=1 Tax=Sulfidibacter corallicola TaxID=2818388 RepID=A0A8A4TIU2_SULCO|nr:hypothetical protein [Sulfidibacter corallicola]QTD48771.1 hypothetical protein J3U87_24585 [Sulfidibacter corallicola]
MSTVIDFMTDLVHDPAVVERFEQNPTAVLDAAGLDAEKRYASSEAQLWTRDFVAANGSLTLSDPGPDPLPDPDPFPDNPLVHA